MYLPTCNVVQHFFLLQYYSTRVYSIIFVFRKDNRYNSVNFNVNSHSRGKCGCKLPPKLQELFRTYTVQLPFPYIIETSSLSTYFWMENIEQKLLILELQYQFPLTKLI
ncbi:unnamed protein product [Prunus brigantina]